MKDEIQFEILADGTISVKTPGISLANHVSADKLLKDIATLAGGERQTKKRVDVAYNLAGALHTHTADGHHH